MYTHAGSSLHNPVTLTSDLLTSEQMHTDVLPQSICVPSLVLIAQVVFLSECGHTDTQTHKFTDATDHPIYASITAGVGGGASIAAALHDRYCDGQIDCRNHRSCREKLLPRTLQFLIHNPAALNPLMDKVAKMLSARSP